MGKITALFWDVGGVLLTNGWDTSSRRRAVEKFELDWDAMQERHELVGAEFEKGRLTLDDYVEYTIFYEPRDFSKEAFREFMFTQSQPNGEVLSLAERLAASRRYLMATLNNESRELNLYRIEMYRLWEYFTAFLSSCYLGVRKPEKAIYHVALEITQRPPSECLFIDDRRLNLEWAQRLGMTTIQFQDPVQLQRELQTNGVEIE